MFLEVNDLYFKYNVGLPTETTALKHVSFKTDRGKILSIVGHTGSGKSTLAMHLNGLLMPDSGDVAVDGTKVSADPKTLKKIRQKVGLVFQYPEQQIFAETVCEEISFGPYNWGFRGAELEERVISSMKMLGIDPAMGPLNPFTLSGGEKRRLAIASVLASDPDCLVLDEPTAGLDFTGIKELTSLLGLFADREKCVVHVTHDLELAFRISDAMLILSDGCVAASGSPAEIAEKLSGVHIKGLVLPDILALSYELKKHGRIDGITADPLRLAEMLKPDS